MKGNLRGRKDIAQQQPQPPSPASQKIDELHDQELLDFVRETVVKLNVLADRLESYAQERINERGAGPNA